MNLKNVKKVLIILGTILIIILIVWFIWFISTQPINWANVYNGLKISGIGLAGVFTVLIVFYLSTKLMMSIAKKYTKPDNTN